MSPRGLPGALPPGERLLWQGGPDARALLVHAFHVRLVALYFGVVLAWSAAVIGAGGGSAHALALGLSHRMLLAAVPFALVAAYAWAVTRSTVYTITSRRVVISSGLAVPVTFNLPFSRIETAGLKVYRGGAGDIPLRLMAGEKLGYFALWPHARPWHMARPEPMLRCVPEAAQAAAALSDGLSDAVSNGAPTVRVAVSRPVRLRPAATGLRSGQAVAAE